METIKFGNIAEFRNGLNFSKESHGNGCYIIGVSDFQDRLVPDYGHLSEINPHGIAKEEDYLRRHDIIFVRSNGNKKLVGRSLYINSDIKALFSGFCIRARIVSKKIKPLYCAYYTRTEQFRSQIFSGAGGTNIQNLSQGILSNIHIPCPPIDVQDKIVKVLQNLDRKIEINKKINAELEAMTKTIYDYWFVQFDFPDKNGKPYKSSGGKMAWNKAIKRDIPADWTDSVLSSIAKITMGQSPPGESYNEKGNGLPFFQGCTDFGVRFPDVRQYTYMPSRIANPGDILLSVRAPVGSLNIANEKCCIGRGLAALKSNNGYTSYLWGILRHLAMVFERRNVDGTTFGAITKDDLFSLAVIKPSEQVLKRFQSATKPAYEMQNKIELENRELIALRDWLLPMLMNGQIQVAEIN